MFINCFITQVTNIPIISCSHQDKNKQLTFQHIISKNSILTSKSVLDIACAQVNKMWDLQDLISNSSTFCDSILIPLFEIEKRNLPQNFEKDSYFNKTNRNFCQSFSIIVTESAMIIDLFKKEQEFKGTLNFFIVKNANPDRLTVYFSLTLTHLFYFRHNKIDLHFVDKTFEKEIVYYTIKLIKIKLDFNSKTFKELWEPAKVNINQKNDTFIQLKEEGE
ncbi:hypothetical protein CDIK_3563 [Cucumispora dikerogammari]|nr:hypothetical protein CDIK_3563 [Cucumispora dikerogammari]